MIFVFRPFTARTKRPIYNPTDPCTRVRLYIIILQPLILLNDAAYMLFTSPQGGRSSCLYNGLSTLITGSIARSAMRWYLIYSEADFEVSCPAGATRCTDWGEIWPPLCQTSPQSVQRLGYRSPKNKTEIFTEIWSKCGIWTPRGGVSLAQFSQNLQSLYPVLVCVSG